MDREKVIKEIEDALSDNLAKAGYIYGLSLNGLKDKALTDVLVLLKEQEAVEPINSYGTFRCGNCRNVVGYNDGHGCGYQNNFCSKCGKAVKWE